MGIQIFIPVSILGAVMRKPAVSALRLVSVDGGCCGHTCTCLMSREHMVQTAGFEAETKVHIVSAEGSTD